MAFIDECTNLIQSLREKFKRKLRGKGKTMKTLWKIKMAAVCDDLE